MALVVALPPGLGGENSSLERLWLRGSRFCAVSPTLSLLGAAGTGCWGQSGSHRGLSAGSVPTVTRVVPIPSGIQLCGIGLGAFLEHATPPHFKIPAELQSSSASPGLS